MISRHALLSPDGLTQASSVIPVVKLSDAESTMFTSALDPLNESAPPYFPALDQVAPLIVPELPLPEESATVVPAPSLNPSESTRPVAVLVTVTVTGAETEVLPLVSRACDFRTWLPLATAVEFQLME